MVNKCCVPGCTSNYKSGKREVAFESVPENENKMGRQTYS